jgi:hypothetical protein
MHPVRRGAQRFCDSVLRTGSGGNHENGGKTGVVPLKTPRVAIPIVGGELTRVIAWHAWFPGRTPAGSRTGREWMRFLMAVASPTSNEVLFRKHDRWRTLHTLVYTATRSMLRSRGRSR